MFVVSDGEVAFRAAQIRDSLNLDSDCRLYVPDIDPTPDTPLMNLTEVIGAGYSPFSLTNLWSVPHKQQPGWWYFETPIMRWAAAAGPGWSFRGLFILGSAGLFGAERLPGRVVLTAGGSPFFLKVRVFVASANLLVKTLIYAASRGGVNPGATGDSQLIPV